MNTQLPIWKLSANLGDVNPLEGGALLYSDETGVYPPELVLIEANPPKNGGDETWRVSRIVCDRCHPVGGNGVGSNQYHPAMSDWFSDKLPNVADYRGTSVAALVEGLCDANAVARGLAYHAIISYFGAYEFDQDPVEMTGAEIRAHYSEAFFAK